MAEWITTGEAAQLGGYHADYIRQLIRAGKLKAKKFGFVWMVDRAGVLAHLRKTERMGNKRGPKRES